MWRDGRQRLRRTLPLNVVCDGNSLVAGIGAGGVPLPAQVGALLAARFPDAQVANLGISGQTWRQMDGLDGGSATDVDGWFMPSRTNVLVLWEGTNAVADVGGGARTPAQAAGDAQAYLAHRLAANPGWLPILLSTLPRQGNLNAVYGSGQAAIDAANAGLDRYDAIVRAACAGWGVKAYVDVRCTGSPFRLADYAPASFDHDPQLWNEPGGGRLHLSAAGYAVIAAMVTRAIVNLPAR